MQIRIHSGTYRCTIYHIENVDDLISLSRSYDNKILSSSRDIEVIKRTIFRHVCTLYPSLIEKDKIDLVLQIDLLFDSLHEITGVHGNVDILCNKLFNKRYINCRYGEIDLINKIIGSKYFDKEWDKNPGLRALFKTNLREHPHFNKASTLLQLKILKAIKNDKPVANALNKLRSKSKLDKWCKYDGIKHINKLLSKLPSDNFFPTALVSNVMHKLNYFPEKDWECILLCSFNHRQLTKEAATDITEKWINVIRNSTQKSLNKVNSIQDLRYSYFIEKEWTANKLSGLAEFISQNIPFGLEFTPEDTIFSIAKKSLEISRSVEAERAKGILRRDWPDWVYWVEQDPEWQVIKTKQEQKSLGNEMHFCIGRDMYSRMVINNRYFIVHHTPINNEPCTLLVNPSTLEYVECHGKYNHDAYHGPENWDKKVKEWKKYQAENKKTK